MDPKQQRFHKAVDEWVAADKRCQTTYKAWLDACEQRRRRAVEKNDALAALDRADT